MKVNNFGRRVILFMISLIMTSVLFAGCKDDSISHPVLPTEAANISQPERTPLPTLTPQPEVQDRGGVVNYTISGTISSNMIVQRNAYFNVFGWSPDKGGILYGEFMGEKRYAIVDDKGEWSMQFSSHEATTEPQTLKIYPQNGKMTEYSNILVGDVWIISGQSNAELTFSNTVYKNPEYKKEINKDDLIRIFIQRRSDVLDVKNQIDLTKTQDNIVNSNREWCETTITTVSGFSALGYYFAKELSKTVTDVPIGVVMTAAIGAVLHELMPSNVAASCGFTTAPTVPVSGYYNALIHPFTKNAITGMVFYQGESEASKDQYKVYAENLKKTVEEYRRIWNFDFAFINVQLSTHMGDSPVQWPQLPDMRAEQYNAYKIIPNSYIVTAMDQNFKKDDTDWAHPCYKLELGRRAASIASSVVYKKLDSEYAFCPEPDQIVWEETSVLIDFKYIGDGLKLLEGNTLSGFELYDELGAAECKAELIDSNTVRLTPTIVMDEIIGFGYGMEQDASPAKANLANSLGYPMPAVKILK